MAENESLDLFKSRRWQSVLHLALRRELSQTTADKARQCLYRTVRAVMKQIPLEALLSVACDAPHTLPDIIRQCKQGRDYARQFQEVAETGAGREAVLENYVWSVCDRFFDQITEVAAPTPQWRSLPALRAYFNEVRALIEADVHRIAHELAENPSRAPRMKPGKSGGTKQESTEALLVESLLGVRQQ